MLKKLPLPIAGLMLALAATGNLVLSYGEIYHNIFGVLSACIFLLLLAKIMTRPQAVPEGFQEPLIASVMPTFSMGMMLLATYLKPYMASLAYFFWLAGLLLHVILIIAFTGKYVFRFDLKNVFPSYFIVYVGIVCGSVTAPAFALGHLGRYIFYFGLLCYFALLPFVLYRTLKVKNMPEPALPALVIYTAPASLCLAGYLNAFEQKSPVFAGLLAVLALVFFVAVILKMPKLLALQFYPSFSAFTFPHVITAVAMKLANAYFTQTGIAIPGFAYFVKILEAWAVLIVIYVLVRYLMFLFSKPQTAKKEAPAA